MTMNTLSPDPETVLPSSDTATEPLLSVRDLKTYFFTDEGTVKAVDNMTYSVDEGETVAIVGESGSGKSVGALSILQLIPDPPGKILAGEVFFEGQDLLKLSTEEVRQIRGRKISMVFQEPMTSLNPVLSIGMQLTETMMLHLGLSQEQANKRAEELLGLRAFVGARRGGAVGVAPRVPRGRRIG